VQNNLGVGDFDLPARGYGQEQTEYIGRFADSGVFGKKYFNELRVQARWQETEARSSTIGQTILVPGAFNDGSAQRFGGRKQFDLEIADNVDYVRAAIAAIGGAVTPVVYAGFSQGVAMAFRAAQHAERPAAGVIGVGGDVPPELLGDGALRFSRALLARGATDEWYTADKLNADVAALRARGVDVQEFVYDGGHEWTPAVAAAAAGWLQTCG